MYPRWLTLLRSDSLLHSPPEIPAKEAWSVVIPSPRQRL